VRSLLAVDLWEISIVTFPLLNGARVQAVKQAGPPLRASRARTHAEAEWARMAGAPPDSGRPPHSQLSSPGTPRRSRFGRHGRAS